MEQFSIDGVTVQNLTQWRQQTGQDRGSVVATPASLFTGAGSNDYHLSAGSPARDAGVTRDDVLEDRDGTPRPFGAASDIGAVEFRPTLTPPAAPTGLRVLSN